MGQGEDLGMSELITRRDFLGGVATSLVVAAALEPSRLEAAPDAPEQPYPPLLQGLRGQYPGSFETAHQVRDGRFSGSLTAQSTSEHYDLVVVGGGISGLAAARFFRKARGESCRVLILDNHDDFGGHAKRNEFRHEGRVYLSFGGSMSIETPFPYSYTAKALLAELGIDASSYPRYRQSQRTQSLGRGIFFDRENFGHDKTVAGFHTRPWSEFFAAAPLTAATRADLLRLYTASVDYLPGLDPVEKSARLKSMSYQQYLIDCVHLSPDSLKLFNGLGWGYRNNKRLDTCPAFEAWRAESPGFAGMSIADQPRAESEHFHFPDGNASIARLLVSRLVPGVFEGFPSMESIVLAPARYAALDLADNSTRVRLSSTVVRVEHLGEVDAATEKATRIVYAKDGRLLEVTAANVILACFNQVIPYLVPALPDPQKAALHYASKVPMQVTNVLVRNWRSLERLGVASIYAPNGYHTDLMLDEPLSIGGYSSLVNPDEPAVLQLIRNPNKPGLPRREQNRAGRAEMLATSFVAIELATRSQLQRMLGEGGFDSKRDILAITVNRWPHGYAYTYDSLGDPPMPESERPHVLGRKAFGRIAIANADAGAGAFVNVAIDQAERAVHDVLASRGLL
jgi:spermidine dehydrogenase